MTRRSRRPGLSRAAEIGLPGLAPTERATVDLLRSMIRSKMDKFNFASTES